MKKSIFCTAEACNFVESLWRQISSAENQFQYVSGTGCDVQSYAGAAANFKGKNRAWSRCPESLWNGRQHFTFTEHVDNAECYGV